METSNLIEQLTYRDHTISIIQDNSPESPRLWSNIGTMVLFHGRYNLGDKDHGISIETAKLIESNKQDKYIVLPVYMYDHSGITISTQPFSCPWDSGQIGIIFASKEKVRKEYGWKKITSKRKEKILDYLISEVKVYDNYLTGNVYGFEIEETGDSSYGFYGDQFENNGLLEYAKNVIDYKLHNDL